MALSIDTSVLSQLQQKVAGEEKKIAAAEQTVAQNAAAGEKWKVPKWEEGFDLAPALRSAYVGACTHMNQILAGDDLYVDLQPQGDDVIGEIKDSGNGQVVKTYSGLDILRLYSHNVRPRGVIVDGAL